MSYNTNQLLADKDIAAKNYILPQNAIFGSCVLELSIHTIQWVTICKLHQKFKNLQSFSIGLTH